MSFAAKLVALGINGRRTVVGAIAAAMLVYMAVGIGTLTSFEDEVSELLDEAKQVLDHPVIRKLA